MEMWDWKALMDWRHESEPATVKTKSARIPRKAVGMDPKALSVGPARNHTREVYVKSTRRVVATIHIKDGRLSLIIPPPRGTVRTAKPVSGNHLKTLQACVKYIAERI